VGYPLDTPVENVLRSTQMRCRPWDLFRKSGKNHSDLLLVGALDYDYQIPRPLFDLVQYSNKYITTILFP
jgi:hypothetical protein